VAYCAEKTRTSGLEIEIAGTLGVALDSLKKEGNQVNFECKRHNNYFLKVSKSQKHFFLKLHCQTNE
jgi:ribosomal protein L13E